MRDHRKAQTKQTKHGRRQWLVVLILAGSPCLAQQPQNNGLGVLPPLPLSAANPTPGVHSNPFCASETAKPSPEVQLTTGAAQNLRTAQLSPIGVAIGLNPIGAEQRTAGVAGHIPAMTIEAAHESVIQINPLLQSTHHRNNDLVEATLATARPVSHVTPQTATENTPRVREKTEASIFLVNPAPKPLLVVQAKRSSVATPLVAAKPLGKPATLKKTLRVVAKSRVATAEKQATGPASVTPPPKDPQKPIATVTKRKTASPAATKPATTSVAEKRTAGASIASMLSQTPQDAKGDTAPIFFSLSDSTEVAPTREAKPETDTTKLPKLSAIQPKIEQPTLPAPVTVKPDGSIVTSPRPKPRVKKTQPAKAPIPKPILASQPRIGAGLGLPAPSASPEEISEPVRMPNLSTTAKRIPTSGKSILSSKQRTSAEQREKLSIAAVKQFEPRAGKSAVKSIVAVKPFSVIGEEAKPVFEPKLPKASSGASSVLAKAPRAKKPSSATASSGTKLTLPTPVNVPDEVESVVNGRKSGRVIIKGARPSPKETAQTNPHAEAVSSDVKQELANPFTKKRSGNTTTAAKPRTIPESTEINQAVRVEKYTISKDRPRTKINLDSKHTAEPRSEKVPIASGVVKPIDLPVAPTVATKSPSVVKTQPAVETEPAKSAVKPVAQVPSTATSKPETTSPVVAKAASSQATNADAASGGTILRKRYRPPVAVQTVPGTVQRQDAVTSVNSPKVHAVPEIALGEIKTPPPAVDLQQAMRLDTASELRDKILNLGPDIKLTPLHMNQAQVRALTLGGSVRGVRVGDKGICQAFASGPNQLKLIGTGIGITRLVVWAQKGGDSDEILMRAFEIHVNEIVPSEGNSIESTTELLNQSIKKVFPRSQAKVQLLRGELWVTGACESQDSAEKIVRMVRKSCLIPVRDQLTVK